jgi:hypothetical protein
MKTYEGMEITPQFFIWALVGGEWPTSHLCLSTPGTHWIGGRVDARTARDAVRSPAGNRPPLVQSTKINYNIILHLRLDIACYLFPFGMPTEITCTCFISFIRTAFLEFSFHIINLRGVCSRANCTDRATAAYLRS